MLTFVSRHEALDVLGNVHVEMQLADVERLDNRAVVQNQQPRVPAHLRQHTTYTARHYITNTTLALQP